MQFKSILQLGFAICAGLGCAPGVHATPTPQVDVQIDFLLTPSPAGFPQMTAVNAAGQPITDIPIFNGLLTGTPLSPFSYQLMRAGRGGPTNVVSFTPTIDIGADSITVGLRGSGMMQPGIVRFNFEFLDFPSVITGISDTVLSCLPSTDPACDPLNIADHVPHFSLDTESF